MKKHSLVKVLVVLLLLATVATWFIQGREGEVSYLAFGDAIINFIQTFYYFFDTFVFVIVVGGFYGLLNKTKAYRKMLDSVVKKFKENKKLFVIGVTVLFALISSLTGLDTILLIFIPFVISIILLMGYDKIVALSATIGAVMVGFIGGIFTTIRGASGFSTFATLVGLKSRWANVVPRIVLLVMGVLLLVMYILKYMKKLDNKEVKSGLSKSDLLLIETKDKTGKVVKVDYSKVKSYPLVIMLIVMLVLLVLGFLPWSTLFNLNIFDDFHTWLTGLAIGDYKVFTSLVSANITSFGNWANLGTFVMPILIIILFSIIIKFVYKIKLDSAIDAFTLGAKKMLPAAAITVLAYTLLVCTYNNGFLETIISNASKQFGDNVVINSLITMLGSITNVDLYYTSAGIFTPIVQALPETANLSIYAVAFQSLFGLISLVGPTSILLIVGLTYLDVPYTTWLKYIWRFVLELFIIIFIVMMIVSLI